MTTGLIFDIKEFAINDGPGIRLTVFMKGCPLRCAWCHNPEGISPQPQHNRKTGCMVGKEYTVEELTRRICKFRDVFDLSGGGVTFSGGEPTRQSEFVEACALRLNGIHKTLDTSGFVRPQLFAGCLAFSIWFITTSNWPTPLHINALPARATFRFWKICISWTRAGFLTISESR